MEDRAAPGPRSLQQNVIPIVVLTILYVLSAKWGLRLASIHRNVTAAWPPTGISLAALLLYGRGVWPGVFLGAFIANALTPIGWMAAFGISIGNTLEAVTGAYLVNGYANGLKLFEHVQDFFKFVFLAGLLSTTISASIGVASLVLVGHTSAMLVWRLWITWWLGDACGDVLWAPLIILWRFKPRWPWRQAPELIALLCFLGAIGFCIFGNVLPGHAQHFPLEFLCMPPLIWAAFRFERVGAASVIAILSLIVTWGTTHGWGPFAIAGSWTSLLLAQIFIGVAGVTALGLAVVVSERRRNEEELLATGEKLEIGIQSRTEQLSNAIARLQSEIARHEETGIALRSSETRFKRLVDSNIIGFMIVDLHGTILEANDAFLKIVGYSRPDLSAGLVGGDRMTPPEYRAMDEWSVQRLKKNGFCPAFEKEYVRKDGGRVPVLVGVVLMEDPQPYCVCFVIDVTERRLAQQALQKAYDELELRVQDRTEELSLANRRLQQEIQRRKEVEDAMRNLSMIDALTSLHNRRGFMILAEQHLSLAKRKKRPFLLFFADVDHLKQINDSLGHAQGDQAITETARALRGTFRESDIIARIGGDEFAILVTDVEGDRQLYRKRLFDELTMINHQPGRAFELSVSMGGTVFNPDLNATIDSLMLRADEDLYQLKQNRVRSKTG